jgi:hypothetical protein
MPLALPAVKKVVQFVVESKKNTPMPILSNGFLFLLGGITFYSKKCKSKSSKFMSFLLCFFAFSNFCVFYCEGLTMTNAKIKKNTNTNTLVKIEHKCN